MSWSGQSDATQSISIESGNAIVFIRDSTGWPAGTARGPITRTM